MKLSDWPGQVIAQATHSTSGAVRGWTISTSVSSSVEATDEE